MSNSLLNHNVRPFIQLGEALRNASLVEQHFGAAFICQNQRNAWFTPLFCQKALSNIADLLTEESLLSFIKHYQQQDLHWNQRKKVAVIPSGDLPFSAFRDMLYVLLSGNDFVCKQAPQDTLLLPVLVRMLIEQDADLQARICFVEKLSVFDAVIADGKVCGGETFERYFQRFPNIIRKQQHTTAILTGKETTEELRALAQDIYLYFGLAPRSVTKLYVPEGYDFVPLLHILNEESQSIADHNQYLNNLDYQKAIRLMSSKYYMDAGTFLFEENDGFDTPISVLYYSYYKGTPALSDSVLQIVEMASGKHPFGQAHYPSLQDYPNDMDVMQFLGRL